MEVGSAASLAWLRHGTFSLAAWGVLGPLGLETLQGDERLLRPDRQRRERGVEIGSCDGFGLVVAARQEAGQAADESIARARRVHGLHAKRCDVPVAAGPTAKRAV